MSGLFQTIRTLAADYSAAFGVPQRALVRDAMLGTAALLVGLVNVVALVALIGGGR